MLRRKKVCLGMVSEKRCRVSLWRLWWLCRSLQCHWQPGAADTCRPVEIEQTGIYISMVWRHLFYSCYRYITRLRQKGPHWSIYDHMKIFFITCRWPKPWLYFILTPIFVIEILNTDIQILMSLWYRIRLSYGSLNSHWQLRIILHPNGVCASWRSRVSIYWYSYMLIRQRSNRWIKNEADFVPN